MRLTGQYVESFEREDDPEAFDSAMRFLRAQDIWQHVRPKALEPGVGAELRVSRYLDETTPAGENRCQLSNRTHPDSDDRAVVGASRHDFDEAARTVRRSLVIDPAFQRTPASWEVSLLELGHLFELGYEAVTYQVAREADRAMPRLRRLGASLVDSDPVTQLYHWRLTREVFTYRPVVFRV